MSEGVHVGSGWPGPVVEVTFVGTGDREGRGGRADGERAEGGAFSMSDVEGEALGGDSLPRIFVGVGGRAVAV